MYKFQYRRRNQFAAKKTEMLSKFASDCRACGNRIEQGTKIVRNKANNWVCENCGDSETKYTPSAPRYAIGARTQYRPRGRCEDAPCCGCGCTDVDLQPHEFNSGW